MIILFIIYLSPTDVYHTKDNDLIIDCKVRGNPRPTIAWTKDNVPVVFDERTQQVENNEGQCELVINDPKPSDSGTYVCTATNKLGSQTQEHKVVFTPSSVPMSRRESGLSSAKNESGGGATATEGTTDDSTPRPPSGRQATKPEEPAEEYVRRHLPPTAEEILAATKNKLSFVTHLTNRVFPAGSRVKLACVVQGPEPNPRWLKEENPISFGARFKNASRDGICGLEILNVTPEDSGTYTLIVRNSDCNITSSCSLNVYETSSTADFAPTFTRNLKRKNLHTNCFYFKFKFFFKFLQTPTT